MRHFEDGDPSIGIFADEGGQFFGGHGMNRDNVLKTISNLSKLWDASALNRTRAGAPQTTFRHRRGALHLMIQPGIAEGVLANETLRDQGFLSRLLIAWPHSRIGQRLIETGPEVTAQRTAAKAKLAAYQDRIRTLLDRAPETPHAPLELRPKCLTFGGEAESLLINFANQIESAQGDDGTLAQIRGFASKAAEQAARIAGVLTTFDDPEATTVSVETMGNALAITSGYVAEAQRLLDAGDTAPWLAKAQTLLDWLKKKRSDVPFSNRDIVRFGPNSIRDRDTVERLLHILETHRHICPNAMPMMVDGVLAKQNWSLTRHD